MRVWFESKVREREAAMKIDSVVVGSYRANCYVLREGTSMIVVDPGDEPAKVLGLIDSVGGVGPAGDVQIIASHCHCDHIGAVNEVSEAYSASFAVGREDGHAVGDPHLSGFDEEGRDYRVEKVDRLLDDGDEIILGPYRFQVISTPGHTPGSVCLYCAELNLMFTGDTLFANGIGRTDFIRGDAEAMRRTCAKLGTYPDSTILLPGHGPSTRLGAEKARNPLLRA